MSVDIGHHLPDPAIPAIAELAAMGARFVLWQYRDGKKVPISGGGHKIDAHAPKNWGKFANLCGIAHIPKADGIGFVFNGDGIGGVDLDACRDPETGELAAWAREVINDFASYTEVSPSGTGVKIFASGCPTLGGNKLGHGHRQQRRKAPAIEATGRALFALTGQPSPARPTGSPTQRPPGSAWSHGSPLGGEAFCPGGVEMFPGRWWDQRAVHGAAVL